ncbi:MAG: N-acetylglucosamine-6-phosphate deacetylase [Thermovenabulum sp.]|uniref:N-acetylglucosamine-6-phosphate deacetylase n=1 Tax=Thermovenabulum sp. TaxID=3100335 RepID=UPI003C7D7D13
MRLLIKNAKIIAPYEIVVNHGLAIENGKIADFIENRFIKEEMFDEVIDAEGNYLSPGFIDIHCHGAFGFDVMDEGFSPLENIAKFQLKNGVTSFFAAVMTAPVEKIRKSLKNITSYILSQKNSNAPKEKAKILGIYLEGPYFSPTKKGAQPEEYLRKPDKEEIITLLEDSMHFIKVVSLAPELEGALEAIKLLKKEGVIIALGHTDADYEEAKRAIYLGASLATHTYNGMRGFSHREPGVLGAVLSDDGVYSELIADCVHVHPAAMKLLVKAKGTEKIILITDSMMAAGLSDGEYTLSGQKVKVKNGIASLPDGTLAGSTLTLNKAIYNMVYKVGVTLQDAVKMATFNPARALGFIGKGSIEVGNDAELVIFDENINILRVI